MAYINSIQIPPQESAEALAQAAAAALGNALGWTVSGTSVWQNEDKSGLRFLFSYNDGHIFPTVGNSLTSCSARGVGFGVNTYYMLDYYDTGNTIVVGLRQAKDSICLWTLIAKNTSGKFKAFTLPYSGGAHIVYYLSNELSAPYTFRIDFSTVTAANVSTSIVRYPDFWGECMFEDLYLVLSCPHSAADKVFYIGGKFYRYVGDSGTNGFAIPVK